MVQNLVHNHGQNHGLAKAPSFATPMEIHKVGSECPEGPEIHKVGVITAPSGQEIHKHNAVLLTSNPTL